MTIWELFLICVMQISAFNQVNTANLFIIQCSKAQKNELLFFGTCYGQNQNIYPRIMDIVSKIKSFNPDSTLSQFLSDYIFLNSTKFFEQKYGNNSEYLDNLSELKTQLTNFLSKMETSLSDVTIADFLSTFEKSSFDSTIKKIITNNENYINSLELNDTLRNNLTCQEGTFCQLTTKIMNIRFSNELNSLTIKEFLNHFVQNGFNYLNNIFLTNDKREAEKTIENWNNKGTKNIKMSEVAKFIDNRLIGEILYEYEPLKTTVKTSTTKPIKKTTTRAPKVIDEVAVSKAVIWTIPLLILFGAIFASIGIAHYVYKFRPIIDNKIDDKINEMESKIIKF